MRYIKSLSPLLLVALSLAVLSLVVAACSSTGDPESELLQATSSAPTQQQPADTASVAPQEVSPAPNTAPVLVTTPVGIAELPSVLWPSTDDPSPTAEDALKDYLLHYPYETEWSLGYELVIGCTGITIDTNVICAREPRVSDEGERQIYTYQVGEPPPEIPLYSVGIEGSDTEGWWIIWGNAIAR